MATILWTTEDTRNAALASIVPAGIGLTSLLSSQPGGKYNKFLESVRKPDWASFHPIVYSVIDALTLSHLGYASYLIYRKGGGFDNHDTAVALGLYGTNLLFVAATPAFLDNKSFKGLAINTSIVFGTAVLAALAFKKIDEKSAWLLAPYAAWTGFYSLFTYKLYQLNKGFNE
uniref:Tryptophan-rich sensory protein n=1 Tax=Panagrellus redivivus TaxID=6233 RepID=A0A7E4UQC2_PANRE